MRVSDLRKIQAPPGPPMEVAVAPRAQDAQEDEECCVHLNADALHDLVGPANQMRSMAELIMKKHRGKLDEDAEVLFGFMQVASDRLQTLISGLRTHARIVGECQPFRNFDANVILEGALATIQGMIEQTNAVIGHDPLPEVYGDPSQVCYIFVSLFENAIKFRSERTPEIFVTATPREHECVFSVKDNGLGIDPKHRDKIFGVFKRVHNDSYPGAGMGLPIVRRLIQQHGGRIWVESALGEGATFFFTLPNPPVGHKP